MFFEKMEFLFKSESWLQPASHHLEYVKLKREKDRHGTVDAEEKESAKKLLTYQSTFDA